ncbi:MULTISPECIES: ROK family protein [unclassified Mesorhizobium]|uniref:ROK family protein n=1 Tax=unclassified Mesorhizobium TaxID=325217 RepID=UPI000F75C832|nr:MULTISPECIES: ROK family protein [unclassified Mesorhizobium]AZO04041.1 ROK family protein [Mesorhizobium sp. M2A.F.Ca.ET.043.02.1.1]RUW39752.1 ROK family protein [Mesorhizobium sp. M2A.F.Ca.ET.015.02.1.1]RUW74292.1 ROK family protein [Mesorhizobium sp. M2A.F.Ca.ET.067.02.1.1]RVC91509.1 ROK family protein [Mesorhizobium sp. M2A.F.Ca.ET.017.03.2.1]RVD08599.1 ROK family protein [Mesorhizobium sp. M2A.F.Ca.ET.029.05.1.1]
MAKAAKTAATGSDPIVLSIDVGGSHVKILTSAGGEMRRVPSGPSLTPDQVVASVGKLAEGLTYDLISMGFPGPVTDNKPSLDPFNLGKGWNGYDFTAAFGKPVKLVNDALMQAIGSYDGGRMLFLGLGTGLGAAMIIRNVGQPMELAHLPYKKGATFEDYVGERGLVKHGKKKWRKYVFDVVGRLRAALQPDYVVIGGGNVDKLDELPEKSRRGDNTRAFEGGFRLWRDKALIV